MMDSAPKDDVSNDEQIDDVAAGPATTPDPEATAPYVQQGTVCDCSGAVGKDG